MARHCQRARVIALQGIRGHGAYGNKDGMAIQEERNLAISKI